MEGEITVRHWQLLHPVPLGISKGLIDPPNPLDGSLLHQHLECGDFMALTRREDKRQKREKIIQAREKFLRSREEAPPPSQ